MAVVGVFGGSFNPVHNGHIAVAREAVATGLVERVLMVLSPLNPLKERPEELAGDEDRLAMLRLACTPWPELTPSAIELTMPRPSYTSATLRRLAEEHPADRFRLLIGADNWECFPRWRDYSDILRDYAPIVYPREGSPMPLPGSGATPLEAGLHEISSTDIRRRIRARKPVNNLLPGTVLEYIHLHSLYSNGNT